MYKNFDEWDETPGASLRPIDEVADVVGIDTVHLLIREYGGTRLFIPKNPRPNHELVL
jgi:hypothetical protein